MDSLETEVTTQPPQPPQQSDPATKPPETKTEPEAPKEPTAREEFLALLNKHYHVISLNFVQECEKLIDKHHPKG